MLTAKEFISKEFAQDLCQRVMSFETEFYEEFPGAYLRCLGYPIYLTLLKKEVRLTHQIQLFNKLMREKFQDLLIEVTNFFQNELKEKVFFSEEISYPGFHIIKVPAGEVTHPNFHRDMEHSYILSHFPELKALPEGPVISFTVLLTDVPSFKSGLLFIKDPALTHQVLVSPIEREMRNKRLSELAFLHEYQTGKINIHSDMPHSIFSENADSKDHFRVTFQGHLVKTDSGYLFYW